MLTRGDLPNGKWLSGKIKVIWYFELLPAIIAIPLLILFLTYFIAPLISNQRIDIGDQIIVIILFLCGLCIPYILAELEYKKFIYALGEKDITIKRGLVEKIRYVVPYEKIQDVTVSKTPVETLLGIGTVHIETAGHKDGEIVLPGIENYNSLVNELIAYSKRAKESEEHQSETQHTKMIDLLADINQKMQKLIDIESSLKGDKIELENPTKPLKKKRQVGDFPLLEE